jgi:8-oxo-dGTP pyrophosphatase MutT (NUDIX family)
LDRTHLLDQLTQYGSSHPEELFFVAQFKFLLQHPRCFYRDHLPGHITGSAWITNQRHTKVLLIRHAKLNKWLQPGGHADGIENILSVANKELKEETGISDAHQVQHSLFDIDIHQIPASPDFPAHYHYDIRFLFMAQESDLLNANHESLDIQWVPLSAIETYSTEKSVLRMKDKLSHRNAIWN